MQPAKRAVVLLSGGLDSTTTLAIAKDEGYEVYALSFRYGQRHSVELEAAQRVAAALGVAQHVIADIDLRLFGGSALTADIEVPKDRPLDEMEHGIPITYVPARNTIFLSFALAWAETLGASDIFLGVNALDYSVGGDTLVWARTSTGIQLIPISTLCDAEDSEYETLAVDPHSLQIAWKKVTGRFRHHVAGKRSYRVTLERGQEITITQDHSLFSINPDTAKLIPIRGENISVGMPLVVPFDLSSAASAWEEDLATVPLHDIQQRASRPVIRQSLMARDGYLTNRLGRTRVPLDLPLDDDFLYLVGVWLAEGGKHVDNSGTTLVFPVGGIPGAVDAMRRYFARYEVSVNTSSQTAYDYSVTSSVFDAIFHHLGLFGTAKEGTRKVPKFFWRLSQRQRRLLVAGLWDGDGRTDFKHGGLFSQKSHALIHDLYHCLLLDGIFPVIKKQPHNQLGITISQADDFRRFAERYPLRHAKKRERIEAAAALTGRDNTTGMWKGDGIGKVVSAADLPAGRKTVVYNAGGKYAESVRAQRSAFVEVPALRDVALSRLALLRVTSITEVQETDMFDLSVEGAENFIANGILAHNSGYPDCRPEYIEAYERMANLATKAGVEGTQRLTIHTPLMALNKAQIIQRGMSLGIDYGQTISCYDAAPDGRACGHCDACLLRQKGFREAGVSDPTPYQTVTP